MVEERLQVKVLIFPGNQG
jgi:serine/threonine-protein kinase ULK/ATG1